MTMENEARNCMAGLNIRNNETGEGERGKEGQVGVAEGEEGRRKNRQVDR